MHAVSVLLTIHSITSVLHCTLLDPQLSPHFSTPFPTFAPGPTTSPSLPYPSASPSLATCKEGYALADWFINHLSHNICLWQQLTKLPATSSLRTSIMSSAKTLNQHISTFTSYVPTIQDGGPLCRAWRK